MNELNNIYKIVSNNLNKTNYDYLIKDGKSFIKQTLIHGLVGIITDTITENDLTKENYQKLFNFSVGYLLIDDGQVTLIKKIKEIFIENNITFVFLKGSHLKNLYKKSYYRGMGDIDILVKEEDLEKVNKLFLENEIKLISRTLAHNVYESNSKVNIEIHGGINDVNNKAYQSFLDEIFNYVNDNKLAYEYELVYLVYHLAKHLKAGGIGLRSILDIAIYYQYYFAEINNDVLNLLLLKTKLTNLFNQILFLNNKLFGYSFVNNIEDDRLANELLNYIIKTGVHGVGGKNQMDSRTVGRGRLKLFLSRTFPSFKEMKGYYPSLKYFFILLPFYYLVRLIKLIINPKNYKKVKNIIKSDNKDLKILFDKLNI